MTSVWLHDRSRFKPGASYQCGKARESVGRLVIKEFPYSPRQGVWPRCDKHLSFDSVGCKIAMKAITQSSFDGAAMSDGTC